MAGAAEPDSCGDVADREFGLVDQQVPCRRETSSEHVSVRGYADRLAERALEMTGADTCECSELAQRDSLCKTTIDVFQDRVEPTAGQTSTGPRRRRRQRRVRANDVMCEELACALGPQFAEGRTVPRLARQRGHHAFDHWLTGEELRSHLDISRISFPMFRDHTRQVRVRH